MAFYLTNEDMARAGQPTSCGIVADSVKTTNIPDQAPPQGTSMGKFGSSIPSPLSRLFLFASALEEVNQIEKDHNGVAPLRPGAAPGKGGHDGQPDPQTGDYLPTAYHDLVSELLDMLEFTFTYGDDPDLHVDLWDPQVEGAALCSSSIPAHQLLGQSLKDAFDYSALKGHRIAMFRWKSVNDPQTVMLGGTSPVSLVYTSPNLRTDLQNKGLKFTGKAGNVLFNSRRPIPLHERSEAFRKYLYSLDLRLQQSQVPGMADLHAYLADSLTHYEPSTIQSEIRQANGDITEPALTSQGSPVTVAGVTLHASDNKVKIDASTTDYILRPTSDLYKKLNPAAKPPLALVKGGLPGLKYAGRQWNPSSDTFPALAEPDLDNRTLPGLRDKYPYLMPSDLLEDKIVEVSYDINPRAFFTGAADANRKAKPSTFLLPLKKKFFEYFNVSDLVDTAGNPTGMLTLNHDTSREKVAVRLRLPLINGKEITFARTYDVAQDSPEKLDCYDGSHSFDFAVFPFYRLQPVTVDNVYNVLLVRSLDRMALRFYEPEVAATPADRQWPETPTIKSERTRKEGHNIPVATDHLRVNGPFSLIEIEISEPSNPSAPPTTALAVPLFHAVNSDPTRATAYFSFAIDFGTTNTHVAFAQTAKKEDPFNNNDIHPLGYAQAGGDVAADCQLATFNDPATGSGDFNSFATWLLRELLAPALPYKDIKFPMRTATFQIAGSPQTLEMFASSNVGFNYVEDISKSKNYQTNIKWNRTDPLSPYRMASYFAEMLWIMKNKSLLNSGASDFRVIVTYPLSMSENDQNALKRAWDDAKEATHCSANVSKLTESMAPYYAIRSNLDLSNAYINVDIGGGTTDWVYINPQTKEALAFSGFFAANDLWGDGMDPTAKADKANGFLQYFEQTHLPRCQAKSKYDTTKKNSTNSPDVVSYLFANGDTFGLTNVIQASGEMMQPLLVHFAALMFYTAHALDVGKVDVPAVLSFTGMGSKYLRLISAAPQDIARIANHVMAHVGNLRGNDALKKASLEVRFQDNPKEFTAQGALLSVHYTGQNNSRAINPDTKTFYGFAGEEYDTDLTIGDIKSPAKSADLRNSVMRLYDEFLAMLEDQGFQRMLGKLRYGISDELVKELRAQKNNSFLLTCDEVAGAGKDNFPLNEPMFFWPLKDALYRATKKIVAPAVNEYRNRH